MKNQKGLDEGIEEDVEFLNFGQGGLTITNMPWTSIWFIDSKPHYDILLVQHLILETL